MYCRKCGKEIPEGEKHCYHCGEIFEQKKKMSTLMITIHAVAGLLMVGLLVFFLVTIIKPTSVKEVIVEVTPKPMVEAKPTEEPVKEQHPYQQQLVGLWEYVDEYDSFYFDFKADGTYTHYRKGNSTKNEVETYHGVFEVLSDEKISIDGVERDFEMDEYSFGIADEGDDYLVGYSESMILMLYNGGELERQLHGKWQCQTEGHEDLMFEFLEESIDDEQTDEEVNYRVYKQDELIHSGYFGVGHDGTLYLDNDEQEYMMVDYRFQLIYEGETLLIEPILE